MAAPIAPCAPSAGLPGWPPAPPRVPVAFFATLTAAVGALWCSACAPSLATLQPAHVAPRGHLQAAVGVEIGVPTGTLAKAIDLGKVLADQARTRGLTDPEIARLFDVGVIVAASPPSVGQHLAVAYTVRDRTEVGLRYAGGGWRLGGRYQFLQHDQAPFDLVVGLGIARATTSVPLGSVVPFLEARDFTRWTFDLPVLIGTSRSWFRVWTGPKFLYSRFETSLEIKLPMNVAEAGALRGHATYLGGQGGAALGYRNLFLAAELTMGELSGSATTTTMLSVPTPPSDIGGFVIYPSFAVMGEF